MIGASDIHLEGALGKEGGVKQILFRGCGGLRRDIEMEVIFFNINKCNNILYTGSLTKFNQS